MHQNLYIENANIKFYLKYAYIILHFLRKNQ